MLEINKAQNGSTVEVPLGDSFRVRLPENPTTGYRWKLQSAGDPAFRLEEESFETSPGGIGAGGNRWWRFQPAHVGLAHLEFALQRSWQPQPVETFSIAIHVKAR
jgi:inhibitor of cysteine peptidase